MTDLGLETDFTRFPALLVLGAEPFYLTRDHQGGYLLLSAFCPHSGGQVHDRDDCFLCPVHGWRFDLNTGQCVNGPLARMYSAPVAVRDGRLVVEGDLP